MTDKPNCTCFSCGFVQAVEAAFPNGIDRGAAEAILAITAVHVGHITAQLGSEALLEFSMRVAIARATLEAEQSAGTRH